MYKFSSALLAPVIAAMTMSVLPGPAQARMPYDGRWSVTIQTSSGSCDAAYRYSLLIRDGVVTYDGDGSFDVRGHVARNGAVQVRVASGGSYADGVGRLARATGEGVWHGAGQGGNCSGRWIATRRG